MRVAWPLVPALVVLVPLAGFGLLRVDGLMWFLTGSLLVLAGVMAMHDPWAGALAGYTLLRWLTPPRALGLETSASVVFGLGLLVASQAIPKRWDKMVRVTITIAAVVQVLVATGQIGRASCRERV